MQPRLSCTAMSGQPQTRVSYVGDHGPFALPGGLASTRSSSTLAARRELVCVDCGYGIVVETVPECPMCRGRRWRSAAVEPRSAPSVLAR